MKFCSKCNAPLRNGESFCSNCGAKISEDKDNDYNDGFNNNEMPPQENSESSNVKNEDNNIYSHSQSESEIDIAQSIVEQPSAPPRNPQRQNQEEPYIKKVCPNCNQPLDKGKSVCPYCGYDVARYNDGYDSPLVEEYTPNQPTFKPHQKADKYRTNEKKKSNGKATIIVAVIASIVVLSAVLIMIFSPNNNGCSSTIPTNPTSETKETETEVNTETETDESPGEEYTETETDAPYEPPTETPTEPPTEPPTEAPTESITQAPTELITEPTTEYEPNSAPQNII